MQQRDLVSEAEWQVSVFERVSATTGLALIEEVKRFRNALEHIAGSCDRRAAEVARCALSPPNTALSGRADTPLNATTVNRPLE